MVHSPLAAHDAQGSAGRHQALLLDNDRGLVPESARQVEEARESRRQRPPVAGLQPLLDGTVSQLIHAHHSRPASVAVRRRGRGGRGRLRLAVRSQAAHVLGGPGLRSAGRRSAVALHRIGGDAAAVARPRLLPNQSVRALPASVAAGTVPDAGALPELAGHLVRP